jgi:hypothetical protein
VTSDIHPPDDHPPDAGQPSEVGPSEVGPEAGGEVGEPVPAELVRLAAAVAALDEVTSLPVAEHVRRYDALHGELSDALASIDEV